MKKVLILAYDFPPYNSVGAKRPFSWFKYLKELGWCPTVVTRQWNDKIQNSIDYIKPSTLRDEIVEELEYGTIIRAPFKPNLRDKILLKYGNEKFVFLRKMLTLIYQLSEFYCSFLDNRRTIHIAADKYLKTHKIDIIIATGEPFILFKYAYKLSKKYNIPWVADYRDGWTNNYGIDSLPIFERLIRKSLFRLLERKFINSSKLIITVSSYLKENLANILQKKKIEVVNNGYDNFEEKQQAQAQEKFTISYAGTLYPHQRLEVFLNGFERFVHQYQANVIFQFIGIEFYENQKNRVLNFNKELKKYFLTTNRLAKNDYWNSLTRSNMLLLLANENIDGSCAKVYDYIAAQRKTLLCVNDFRTLETIVKQTNLGIICNNSEEVAIALGQAYHEWQQTGQVKCESKNIEQYSRKEQARKLADLLDTISFS